MCDAIEAQMLVFPCVRYVPNLFPFRQESSILLDIVVTPDISDICIIM